MKARWLALASVLFVSLQLMVYFRSYPIFPQFESSDFSQHVRISSDLAKGSIPSLSSMLLYYGVEFYLALALALTHGEPLIVTRYAMGLLVALSPLLVYESGKALKSDSFGGMAALFYSLSGFVWFDTVFNSGLYSNFFGFLSSLALITASVGFVKARHHAVAWLIFACLAYAVADFSHYTTLFVIVLLPPFLVVQARKEGRFRRGLVLAFVAYAPLTVGVAAFPQVAKTVLGFTTGSGSPILKSSYSLVSYPTLLGSLMPAPALVNLVDLISSDWLALFLLVSAILFAQHSVRRREPFSLFLLAWLVLALAAAPPNGSNWRFALVGLFPLCFIGAWPLFKAWPSGWSLLGQSVKKHRYFNSRNPHPNIRAFGVMALFVFPVFFGSWGAYAASSYSPESASSQGGVYRAMQWLKSFPQVCGQFGNVTCTAVAVDDSRFTYAGLLGVPAIRIADREGISWQDPNQVEFYAGEIGASFVVVTNTSDYPTYFGQTYATFSNPDASAVSSQVRATISRYGNTVFGQMVAGPLSYDGKNYTQPVLIVLNPYYTYSATTLQVSHGPSFNDTQGKVVIWCIAPECAPKAMP